MQIAEVYDTLDTRIGMPKQPREHMHAAAQAAGIPGVSTPDTPMRTIHIAGTNGKGSTAAMLESVLREAGYKTGLFTSPHLVRFTERIRVNGKEIEEAALPGLLDAVLQAENAVGTRLNYFALITLMALICFTREKCDCCILETGMGGRLDPTNCMDAPMLAIITRIGMDHMEFLGNSIEEIAAEKAGIIKPGCDVVLAAQEPRVKAVIEKTCQDQQARLYTVDEARQAPEWNGRPLELGLRGAYQQQNAATALQAIRVLQEKGMRIPDEAVITGMRRASWPGRFYWVTDHTLLDGAHNPQGALALRKSLEQMEPDGKYLFIMGFMADKAYEEILEILAPLATAMIAVPVAGANRALAADTLQAAMRQYCENAYTADSLEEGLELAERLRGEKGRIVVCGSLYLVGEAQSSLIKMKNS